MRTLVKRNNGAFVKGVISRTSLHRIDGCGSFADSSKF
jgi:hypothetical protein